MKPFPKASPNRRRTKRPWLIRLAAVAVLTLLTLPAFAPPAQAFRCFCTDTTDKKDIGCQDSDATCTKKCPANHACTCAVSDDRCPISKVIQSAAPPLAIPIPDIKLSDVYSGNVGGNPWLAEYLFGLYKTALSIALLLSAVMMTIGGFIWMTSGNSGRLNQGKTMVQDAVIGLFVVLVAYIVAYNVNENLVQLNPLVVQEVTPIDFKLAMEVGFLNPDPGAAAGAQEGASGAISSGVALPVPPQSGENVSIEGDDLSAFPTTAAKLFHFCTKPSDDESAQNYDAKIQNLVKVVLGWKKVCYDMKKCAYFRGGYTTIPSGTIQPSLLDLPFAIKGLKNNLKVDPAWPKPECADLYAEIADKWYVTGPDSPAKDPRYSALYAGNGECQLAIQKQYGKEYGARFKEKDVVGADCGTFMVQMYQCAGGAVAYPGPRSKANAMTYTSGQRYGKGREGTDIVVWAATNEADLVKQITDKGGLRFGDLVTIGQQNWQHNFMYTGGRQDVPFAFFEMGGAGADGVVGARIDVGFPTSMGGTTVWPVGSDIVGYLRALQKRLGAGKSPYPVFVWRPYNFETCKDRSSCQDGQACSCTASDTQWFDKNNCSMAHICHKVKGGTYCNNDEQCAKPQTCDSHTCK
ncbi:MAG: pilin [Patescibacteria group bacterium]|nr:pilin [Patescibacteria group bacterium]